ncbi:MAG: thioredoxin family protein [Clostridia bacterium]|nr:thioredoxin family protein [Clostridia bacterium]
MENTKEDKKKLLLRILVPILIVVAVFIIWVLKTYSAPELTDDSNEYIADFVLEAASIDLDALKAYNLPIIIDFGSDSCQPCREMAPVLKKLNAEMQGKAIIKFIDVEKNGEVLQYFPVQVIPTQIFYSADGTPYVPGENLEQAFDLYTYNETGEHALTVHRGRLTEEEMRHILTNMGVSE